MTDARELLAEGTFVGAAEPATGRLVRVDGPEQVLELLDSGAEGAVLLVDAPSATGIAPILPLAAGVICTSGGVTSHLALVAKEFGVPCVVGASFRRDAGELVGVEVALGVDGTVRAAS
jgi:phosphohistidine swiveling domain-containing protein